VIPVVVGSSPISHPNFPLWFPDCQFPDGPFFLWKEGCT